MTVPGPVTGVDLANTECLFERDRLTRWPCCQGAPNHSRRAVLLSCELADAAYSLDQDQWTHAGFCDFSMLINNSLLTGDMINQSGKPLNDLARNALHTLARLRMSAFNPLGHVVGAHELRTDDTTSCKAIVMAREQRDYTLIAIGFMGTGRQAADWVPNLRMDDEKGMHEGFYLLTQEFMEAAPRMLLSGTARRLGRASLSLAEVLMDMRRTGSRFRLWYAGHSQGGAIASVFTHLLLNMGVRPEYLAGYGFATPLTAFRSLTPPESGWPVTHLMNADDLVPRMGALSHMGECIMYFPTRADRLALCPKLEEDPCLQAVAPAMRAAQPPIQPLAEGLSVIQIIREQSEMTVDRLEDGILNHVSGLINLGGDSLKKALDLVDGQLRRGCVTISGDDPEETVRALTERNRRLVARYGVGPWFRAVRDTVMSAHRMHAEDAACRLMARNYPARCLKVPEMCPGLTSAVNGTVRRRPLRRGLYPALSDRRMYPVRGRMPFSASVCDEQVSLAPLSGPKAPESVHRPGGRSQRAVSPRGVAFRLLTAARQRRGR